MPNLRNTLKAKNAKERASIKGQEIARLAQKKAHNRQGGLRIEIVDTNAIEGGVEVFARAWAGNQPIEVYDEVVTDEITAPDTFGTVQKKLLRTIPANTQIGFGKTGEIDIERFIIWNPPILVPDPQGDVVRVTEANPELGTERSESRYREDPQEALLQVIEHNLSVMKNIHGAERIVKGKRGNTTSTFYPDADPESTSVDGWVQRSVSGETWTQTRDGTGNLTHTTVDLQLGQGEYFSGGSRFIITRNVILFDTSSIPDTDAVSSATLSIYTTTNGDSTNGDSSNIYTVSTTATNNLQNSDYNIANWGSTAFSSAKSLSTLIASNSYKDWTLNASGIANISLTGISYFGERSTNDASDNEPTQRGYAIVKSADTTGTTQDPKLVVEHSASATDNSTFFGCNF